MKQNAFWGKIAALMAKEGFAVIGTQYRTNLATLKRQYKKIKDHNKRSGSNRTDWPYLEIMDDLFGSKPWVEPLSTASSSSASDPKSEGPIAIEPQISTDPELQCNDPLPPVVRSTSMSGEPVTSRNAVKGTRINQKKKLQRTGSANRVADVLEKLRQDRQTQHEQRMSQKQEALDLLRSLVDKMSKQN
ncbi:hypothetical protein PPYR_00783 [Photinus pyralis]|uniref:Myb/SANT-like DNA-binding domain-containing protein n=1 Tax=Photinus pyralis TaxID=7054 RepID=A0A1Y1L753_PHOPY|nr:uncharacterized protein LOC116160615 [Photinus pyralis]XP_031329718.1 uncharacterized protein LOC116160615 [Photinus pyralis]XP_031329719.1 uncharacterized protein LOC116160615 [Photinus pyralis]XP_031329720.1 uncharacterized protein LOC116160615 [Photinus pyralis]XP_031329721.1 uncharacterized protein LOC116160615 [Photinus pyralis]KAB0803813.1 hypothetical protein PPYR_00783 [Photinus pyralis]